MEPYYIVFRDDGAGSMEVGRLYSSLDFTPAKLDNRLANIANKLGILPTQLIAHPDPGNALGEANPDDGSYLADIVAGEAINIRKAPDWVRPVQSLGDLARRQFRAAVTIIAWTRKNPGATQGAANTETAARIADAVPGYPVIIDSAGFLTGLVTQAHRDWPAKVPEATWAAFEAAIAGLTPAELPRLQKWAEELF